MFVSAVEVAEAAKEAGWRGNDIVIAVAVAKAESNFDTTLVYENTNGTYDYGVFQVNSIHQPTLAQRTQLLPNARKAFSIWLRRAEWDSDPWNAWTTYRITRPGESGPRYLPRLYLAATASKGFGGLVSMIGCHL